MLSGRDFTLGSENLNFASILFLGTFCTVFSRSEEAPTGNYISHAIYVIVFDFF